MGKKVKAGSQKRVKLVENKGVLYKGAFKHIGKQN